MSDRPRLLDLYCGQHGAGYGYHLAGFDVTGVDIRPMRHHPPGVTFVHGDALEYLAEHGSEFDAVHASPPCRAYTYARFGAPVQYRHPRLIEPTRAALQELGKPYVMENVPGAPLIDPVMLCGLMFGLKTYRHRLFETGGGFRFSMPPHPVHEARSARMGRPPGEGELHSLVGNFSGLEAAREVMGMPWANQDGIRQAVPPAYTEFIGQLLLASL